VIFRSIAVLVLVLGMAALLAGLALLGRAPGLPAATKHLRTMKDRTDPPRTYEPVDMTFFAQLPHRPPMNERTRLENRGVSMEGSIQRVVLSGDGDLHLELVERVRAAADRDTAYVVAEITPPLRTGSRGWSYESLLATFRPNHGGRSAWPAGTARVRISGWLNYDLPYDRPVSTWLQLNGSPRITGWEIHPVTLIEQWDDSAQAWQELVR
jgi:hypothetical protein